MKPLFREFARYVSLNMLGMVALSCYILADTFLISLGLGADGLTALNLAIPIFNFINGTGLMLGMGGGTWYSILQSQSNHRDANRAFTIVLWLGIFFAVLFTAVGLLFPESIVRLFGGTGDVFTMSSTYLRVILLFAPAFLLNNILLCFVRNDGAPHLSMAAMISGSLSNVVLDWIFIFPCGMGIFGAAFATGLAPILSMGILSPHFLRRNNKFHPVLCKPTLQMTTRILASGVPSLVNELSSGIVIIVFNTLIMGLEGNTGVAAYGVIANLSLVVIAMYTGIAQGIQPILSRLHGTGNFAGTTVVLRWALAVMAALSLLVYGVVWLFAPQIASAFNSQGSAALQAIAEQGLHLYFIACPFAGSNVVLTMFFTSTQRPMPAHVISLLRGFFLILPLAFLLAWLGKMVGVWLCFPVTEILVALLAAGMLLKTASKAAAPSGISPERLHRNSAEHG